MKFNLKAFLSHIASNTASAGRDQLPYVGIDEHLNASPLTGAMNRLIANRVVSGIKPLWYERWASRSGENAFAPGRLSVRAQEREVERDDDSTWTEESVLASLVVEFTVRDRLVLMVADRGRESAEMRLLLGRYIRPHIDAFAGDRLGLLVLGRNRSTSLASYAASVEAHLRAKAVAPGYAEAWF